MMTGHLPYSIQDLINFPILQDFDESQYFNNKNSKFNALNDSNVYSSFRFRSHDNPTNIVFQINIFEVKESGAICDQTVATSYYKVNKSLIENCLIDIDLSLLDSQQIIGSLKGNFIFFLLDWVLVKSTKKNIGV